ncbi:MAG: hypothetical protein KJ607_03510, partial [Bacteroidetes bacterium]|nr:hypothetical protein [Bacteroidota bacterium]
LGRIDSTGNLVTLSVDDSIYVLCEFDGIIPDYALGYLGTQAVSDSATVDVSGLDQYSGEDIRFSNVSVTMTVENQIGIASEIMINELNSLNTVTGNAVSLSISSGYNPFAIGKPADPHSLTTDVTPTLNVLTLNDANSNISALVSNLPDKFSYDVLFTVNPGSSPPLPGQGTDFYYSGDEITAWIDVEVPLSLIANSLTLTDTTSLSLDSASLSDVNSGVLTVYTDNYYPIEARTQFYLLNENLQTFDSLFSAPALINAGVPGTDYGRVLSPARTRIPVALDRADIDRLLDTYKVYIVADFSTRPVNEYVKIFSDYTVKFTVTAEFNYHLE